MKVFKETQRFTQSWLLIVVGGVTVFGFYTIFKEYYKVKDTASNDELFSLAFPVIILILVVLLFIFIKLETKIDETGIYYQFFPFHLRLKKISWNELEDIQVRKYNPVMEYGGWGIRGLSRKGRRGMAFNISGNMGIQLILKDGGRLLLGTKIPEKAKETINNYSYKLKE